MDKALSQLIKISNAVGKDSTLVQGGGGNTSFKTADGKYMYIKASGTALKDMNEKDGWRRINLESVLAIIQDKSIMKLETQTREVEVVNRLLLACEDNVTSGARPSVEAHLHGLLNTCVIHLHPSSVGAYVNAADGKAALEKLFKDEKLPPLWVPYVDPGYTLARKIAELVDGYQKNYKKMPQILFLEKHGLFVTAGSANTAVKLVHMVIEKCSSKLATPKAKRSVPATQEQIISTKLCIRRAYYEATGSYSPVAFFDDELFAGFEKLDDARKMLSLASLTPDELVYANGPAMWLDKCDSKAISQKLTSQINKGDKHSVAFLVKDVGLFAVGKKKIVPTVRDIVAYSLFIRANAKRLGGIRVLNKAQQDFINEWESEAFRKKLASGEGEGALKDRIAVVTGAGSGIGKSIAIGLARAGASVGLFDIDTDAAEQTQAFIAQEFPQAGTMVLGCNVTDELSVADAYKVFVGYWGGLDMVVNAAGVAPAYPLVDTPVDKWRFALEVNLTGYMLMAKHAAKIMIEQGMGGSIVNVSSKSGLDASKNNSAYNATKAGELHLARGWAMELGQYGIRVNCVAPGNVFQGSKIWNPQYIKVCAKKYGIKPEEVIPYYVNKTSLKREIVGQDVADSVVFLCSDKARCVTGQVLVCDSGQAMVR